LTLLANSAATAVAFDFGVKSWITRNFIAPIKTKLHSRTVFTIIEKWNSEYCMLNRILHKSEPSSHNHAHIACEIYRVGESAKGGRNAKGCCAACMLNGVARIIAGFHQLQEHKIPFPA
jgi:hypothetical protein